MEIIEKLFTGKVVRHAGTYFTLESARLYTRPEQPVPIYVATAGPLNAKRTGRFADGIITVGATTMFRSYMQQTYAGAQLSNGTWVNNNISGLSSGGTTTKGRAVDLVAPGDLGWALCTPNLDLYEECTTDDGNPSPIQDFGGPSQSSPRRRASTGKLSWPSCCSKSTAMPAAA